MDNMIFVALMVVSFILINPYLSATDKTKAQVASAFSIESEPVDTDDDSDKDSEEEDDEDEEEDKEPSH